MKFISKSFNFDWNFVKLFSGWIRGNEDVSSRAERGLPFLTGPGEVLGGSQTFEDLKYYSVRFKLFYIKNCLGSVVVHTLNIVITVFWT